MWCQVPESPYFLAIKSKPYENSIHWLMANDPDRVSLVQSDIEKLLHKLLKSSNQNEQPLQNPNDYDNTLEMKENTNDMRTDVNSKLCSISNASEFSSEPEKEISTSDSTPNEHTSLVIPKKTADVDVDLNGLRSPENSQKMNKKASFFWAKLVENDTKFCHKILLISSLMAFSRLCGVTQYSFYMVDIIEHAQTSAFISASWASAGVSIFEIIGNDREKRLLDWLLQY